MIVKIKYYIASMTVLVFGVFLLSPAPAHAQTSQLKCGINAAATGNCDNPGTPKSVNEVIARILNIMSSVVGVVAVIMLIVGGFRYITSGGSSEAVGKAKSTILYAVIGLILVAIAELIVRFVLHEVT